MKGKPRKGEKNMAESKDPFLHRFGSKLRLVGLLFTVIIGTTIAISWIKGGDPLAGLNKLLNAVVGFFRAF
jgi:hypothetical protein